MGKFLPIIVTLSIVNITRVMNIFIHQTTQRTLVIVLVYLCTSFFSVYLVKFVSMLPLISEIKMYIVLYCIYARTD